ncbi:tubby C-terminal domain-like protein [Gracilibacillus phocaeensis]|uniref:tubby C-terminal domain-like protein n=1 Tax=Gracilibacillus phocaeensis TaxID=2042304 RepID=UPI001031F546|nr:hypothetical protein [Gracilibacillus phocaeensis]
MYYSFEVPFYKRFSDKKFYYNSKGETVGAIQRFYQSSFQKLSTVLIDGLFLHISSEDTQGESKVVAEHHHYTLRHKWDVHYNQKTFLLEDKTKVKSHPIFHFHYNDKEYVITKKFANKFIHIQESDSNQLAAEWKFLNFKLPRKARIEIMSQDLDIHLVMCVFLILVSIY